ncbi:hypothetical protein, partial [Tolypothrix sp. VBCCA 56010]|uniref:hypothetical protein n=1 Tax=Tolypothrix sp. VBCCA 56010 TaxID=3137731 RepID=UPI003D7C4A28
SPYPLLGSRDNNAIAIIKLGDKTIINTLVVVPPIPKLGPIYLISSDNKAENTNTFTTNPV